MITVVVNYQLVAILHQPAWRLPRHFGENPHKRRAHNLDLRLRRCMKRCELSPISPSRGRGLRTMTGFHLKNIYCIAEDITLVVCKQNSCKLYESTCRSVSSRNQCVIFPLLGDSCCLCFASKVFFIVGKRKNRLF